MDWIERTINKTLGDMCDVEMTGQECDALIAALRAAHEAGCPVEKRWRQAVENVRRACETSTVSRYYALDKLLLAVERLKKKEER